MVKSIIITLVEKNRNCIYLKCVEIQNSHQVLLDRA